MQKIKQDDITENKDIEWMRTVKAWTPAKTPEREPCDDTVSRQAVLIVMQNNHRNSGRDIDGNYVEGNYSENLYDAIISLPPVTSKQKTGHWIHFAASDDCSECGWSTGKYISPSKYCPDCGAKMVELQKNEEQGVNK